MKKPTYFKSFLIAIMFLIGIGNSWGQIDTIYSCDFYSLSTYSYSLNHTATLNGKDWLISTSQYNGGVFYLGCNSSNSAKGVLAGAAATNPNNTGVWDDVISILTTVDGQYSAAAQAYAMLFDNACSQVTDIKVTWQGGNNAFQVYLFGDSGNGFQLLSSTNYATSGTAVEGFVEWSGNKTNYNKLAIVARPGTATGNATNKTIRMSEVFILNKTIDQNAFEAPVITPASGQYRTAQTVTLGSYGNDTTIYYTTNGDDPKAQGTTLNTYTAPFTVSQSTTVKAIAVSGTDTSAVSTATYTFPIEVADIAAFLAAANIENSTSSTSYTGTTEYKITGPLTVTYQNGSFLYVQDNSGSLAIYGETTSTLNNGDVLTGVYGTYRNYYNLPRLDNPILPTATVGTEVNPTIISIMPTLPQASEYVKLEGVTFTSDPAYSTSSIKNGTISFDNSELTIRDNFRLGVEINTARTYTIVGLVVPYNSSIQVFPISITEIIPADPSLFIDGIEDNMYDFGEVVLGQTTSVTCTISAVNLTGNLSLVSSNTAFAVSPSSLTPTDGTIEETLVTITYTATSITEDIATITISGGGITSEEILVAGTAVYPQIVAPVATNATNILGTSFTANWNAVTDASSYLLFVEKMMPKPINRISNGSFEDGTSGWSMETGFGINTDETYEGTNSVYISANATKKLAQSSIPVIEGEEIVISYWYFMENTSTGSGLRIWSTWTGSSSVGNIQPSTYEKTLGVWTQKSIIVTVPEGATALNFEIRVYSGAKVYIDKIEINEVPLANIPLENSPYTSTTTSYAISGVELNTEYQYNVVAQGTNYSDSDPSNIITVTTLANNPDVPSLVVTTAEDTIDAQDGLISLREAINYAFADIATGALKVDGRYVITFDPTVFTSTNNTLFLDSSIIFTVNQFNLFTGGLTIQGLENVVISVDGTSCGRLFTIETGNIISMFNMNIVNGSGLSGAGVYNEGILTIVNSTLANNVAYMNGGAIFNVGTLNIVNSTLTNNGGNNGGGIFNNDGTVNVINSIIAGNFNYFGADITSIDGSVYLYSSIIGRMFDDVSEEIDSYSDVSISDIFVSVENNQAVMGMNGIFPIISNGAASGKGVYVWYSANYSALAISKTETGAKTYLLGSTGADVLLSKDQIGQTITGLASIGSVFAPYTAPIINPIVAPVTICNNSALALTVPTVDLQGFQAGISGWELSQDSIFDIVSIYTNQLLSDSCNGWYLRYFAANENATAYSNAVTISVLSDVILNDVVNQFFCPASESTAIIFSATNTGGTLRTTWTNSNSSIGLAANGEGNIPSFTTVNATNAAVEATITVTPYYTINSFECAGESKIFTITILPTVTMEAVASQTVCNNSSVSAITFASAITDGTMRYAWTNDNSTIGLAASGEGNIAEFIATNSGATSAIATITVTPYTILGGVECEGTPIIFTITVNAETVINAVSSQVVCNGSETEVVEFSTSNSDAAMRYVWTNDNTSIGLAASGEGNIAAFDAVNSGLTVETATITVTPYATIGEDECEGEVLTFTITVAPNAMVNSVANIETCQNGIVNEIQFATTNTDATMRYEWTNSNISIGLDASGEGNIPQFTAHNTTTSAVVATITVTPYITVGSVECEGAEMQFTITVNPAAVVNTIADQVVCNGDLTQAILFTTPTQGTVRYEWSNNNTNIGLAASGNSDIDAFTAINNGELKEVAVVTVIPYLDVDGTEWAGAPVSFSITVNPTVTVNRIEDIEAVHNDTLPTIVFTSNSTDGTVRYVWSNDNTAIGLAGAGEGNIEDLVVTNTTNSPISANVTVTPHYSFGEVE